MMPISVDIVLDLKLGADDRSIPGLGPTNDSPGQGAATFPVQIDGGRLGVESAEKDVTIFGELKNRIVEAHHAWFEICAKKVY